MGATNNRFRSIPSVDRLLNDLAPSPVPRVLLAEVAREYVSEMRATGEVPTYAEVLRGLQSRVIEVAETRIQSVINATGIPLHTNLGRSPLSAEGLKLIHEVAAGYCNLEYQIGDGTRGSRGAYVERCFRALCGSSGAAVVNNCAAALFLVLSQAVRDSRPEVIISRGELVQIGGGFRIPDILEASGAQMREVGTTNRTTLSDYERALSEKTGLILVVHRSNFYMEGFVETPSLKDLAALAAGAAVPLVYDQGSGAVVDTAGIAGLGHEQTVKEALALGANVVCFSGDKLLGGAQAGLICGDEDRIRRLKGHPMYRALRCDKLILSALQATAEDYLRAAAGSEVSQESNVPVYRAMLQSVEGLKERAEALVRAIDGQNLSVSIVDTETEVGGGTMPQSRMASVALMLSSQTAGPQKLARLFRRGSPPVVGYVADGVFHLDLRAMATEQDDALVSRVREVDAQLGAALDVK